MTQDFDILIIGGGLVGASLACALQGSGLCSAVIEARELRTGPPGYDDRVIALSYGTRRIFEGMGLWPALAPHSCPIRHIHISERGRFGAARLDARREGVEALGYVAPARAIGAVLGERLAQLPEVTQVCPAEVTAIDIGAEDATVTVQGMAASQTLRARLVVAADGADSRVREALDIATTRWTYGQTAVIANVTPGRAHDNIAYERFTDSGPLALLPLDAERCSLVWTVRDAEVDTVLGWSDGEFLAHLQDHFGDRLGLFKRVGARAALPLGLVRARESVRPRLALIGNAAHTLHPVAGQGFNLGLRDVAALAEVLTQAVQAGGDVGDHAVLDRYAQWRTRDQRSVIAFTDGLARLFTNPLPPLPLARTLGLIALEHCPPLKHALTRRTMGLAGRLPRLARGLSLVK